MAHSSARCEIAPGTSASMRFRRASFCVSLTRPAFAASSEAAAASTVELPTLRFCWVSASWASAEATASW